MKLATCHSNRKCQARGLCKSCYDKWLKANNPKYKADQAANTTKWLKIHPDKRIAIYLKRKAKIALDPETQRLKQRARGLKKKYGIAMADYLVCSLLLEKKEFFRDFHFSRTQQVIPRRCG